MSIASPLSQLSVLRRKLDLMGYHEPLPLEAVPLVALLFRDFLQLTENFNNLKIEHSHLTKLRKNFEDNVEPYKEENAKLIKENNELHQEIMKMRENYESTLLDMRVKAKKLEDENMNLKFLNNQYLQKTKNFKKVSQEMSEEVLRKGHRVRKSHPFCHEQCTELRDILRPLTTRSFHQTVRNEDSEDHPLDLLQLSTNTILKLQSENAELLEVAEQAHKAVKSLQEKVTLRDKEIERLTFQVNQGKPLQAICLETKERKKDDVIQNLQQQLESMYHQNEELEKIIIKFCGKEYLPEKVRPGAFYDFLDSVCCTDNDAISRQLGRTTVLQDKSTQDTLSGAKYAQRFSRMEKALKLANIEKRKLAEKIATLLTKEKELQSEIRRLKRKVPPHGIPPSQCSERLARLVQVLEAQRDFFKEECETLKRLQGKDTKVLHKLEKKSSSDTKISEITTKDHESTETVKKRSFVNLVEEERDFYKEKYTRLLEQHGNLKEEIFKATADKGIMVTDDTPQKLRKENFDLLQRIRELEHQINQINSSKREQPESEKQKVERKNLEKAVSQLQNTVEELEKKLETTTREKQVFMQRYQQAVIEHSKLREGTSAKADPAQHEPMPNMYTDADVQERIEKIEQQHKSEDAILHQQIKQLQNVITGLKEENENLKDSLSSHKAMISSLEHQVSSLHQQWSQAVDESDQHKTAAEHIRLMIGHGEQSTEHLQRFLIQKEGELDIADKRMKALESDLEELKDILKHREAEITDLKSAVINLEHDKEELSRAMKEKDLQLSSVQQQVYSKELHASELKITASALEADVEKVQSDVRLKDEEINSLKEQLESKSRHVAETSHTLDVLRQENSRLLEELSLLTKEHRFVTETLEEKLQELEELKKKDIGYVEELTRIQEVVSIKEQQRSELIQQYKELSYENARLEAETRRLRSEAEAVQLEMQTKDAEAQNFRSTIQSLELEVEEFMSAQEAHRLEMTFLNSSVSGLEAELFQKQQEVDRLQMELQDARALSVQLDASKEHFQKLLADEGATNAKLTSELDDLRDEIRALQAQLSSERSSMTSMENLMATHREKDFRSHLMNQELNAEISVLRNRLKESLEKVEALSKELSSLKTKAVEMEMERERLKREVTDERYERERDHNELLRLQHLQQLYTSEPTVRPSSSRFQPEFSSHRFKFIPSQKTVPVLPTSAAQSSGGQVSQPQVSSRTRSSSDAERDILHLPEVQSSTSVQSADSSQTWTKETTTQVLLTSSTTRSSHRVVSSERQEKESPEDNSSHSSSKETSNDNSS